MLINLLIHLLILFLVMGAVYWVVIAILNAMPGIPTVFRQVAIVVMLLIFLLIVVGNILPLAGMGNYGLLR